MPPRKKRLIDVKEMQTYLENTRNELHDEIRDSQCQYKSND